MRFWPRSASLLLFIVVGQASWAQEGQLPMVDAASFTASGTTQAALTVACSQNLSFGTIGIEPNNAAATISVDAAAGATASSSNDAAAHPATSDSGPGECTVSNETGFDATASLSASSGTFADTTLSGVRLRSGMDVLDLNSLSADIELEKATGIGNETIHIGGALQIPADHTAYGTYTTTITVTVTD